MGTSWLRQLRRSSAGLGGGSSATSARVAKEVRHLTEARVQEAIADLQETVEPAGSLVIRERKNREVMLGGATLEDLAWMENVYSPPIGALNEPIAMAAQNGLANAKS